jgi:hypothetical protein
METTTKTEFVREYMPAHTSTIIDGANRITVNDNITGRHIIISGNNIIFDTGVRAEISDMVRVLMRALS